MQESSQLSSAYFKEARRRGLFIKSDKWKSYFEDTAFAYSSSPEWNPTLYIKFLFDRYQKVYPTQLKTKKYWKEYVNYFDSLKTSINYSKEEILKKIAIDLKVISKQKNISLYIQENDFKLSKYILVFCKSKQNDFSEEDLVKYKVFFHDKAKVKKLICRILKEECVYETNGFS